MISGLNHYNLRSEAKMMEILKNFYIEIVGLELGVRPPFQSNGYWLNVSGKDILHLSETKENDSNPVNIKNTFDHMAFTAEDRDKYIKILEKNIKTYGFFANNVCLVKNFSSRWKFGTMLNVNLILNLIIHL